MHPEPDPYELLVDRYMPGASEEERTAARRNLDEFIALLIRLNERAAREAKERDSRESDSCARVEQSPNNV